MLRAAHVICLVLVLLLTGWANGPARADGQPRKGGTLVFGRGADSTYLDPAMFLDGESHKVIESIFDGLARFADDSPRIEPALAASWQTSEDGLVWTFRLREDVVFHDGTSFDAEAAAFSLRRRTDPNHPFYRKEFAKRESSLDTVKEVEVVDRLTLRVRLSEPSAGFLNALASHSAYMVSPEAIRKWGDDFNRHPVGTGAFALAEWLPGERIILVKNKKYWKGEPNLDRVVFEVVPDTGERYLRLKAGSIQAMDGVSPDVVSDALRRKDLRVESKPGLNVGYLAMNMDKPPFDKVEVRRAINHAINKENLIKFHFQGLATPAKNPIPPTLAGYDDSVVDYAYDPAEAKRLLRVAGLEKGFKATLWAMPAPRPYMPQPEQIAASIKANLAAVGVQVEIVSCDWKTYLAKLYNGEHDMCLLGWVGSGADPDHFFYNLFAPENAVKPNASNVAFFRNEEAGKLIREARSTLDPGAREVLYGRLQKLIHDQAPWTPLAHASQIWVRSASAGGVVFQPSEAVLFHRAWLE